MVSISSMLGIVDVPSFLDICQGMKVRKLVLDIYQDTLSGIPAIFESN